MTRRKQPSSGMRTHNACKASGRQLGEIEFYRILDRLPSRWRSYFITLAITGMRIAELCKMTSDQLAHDLMAIRVKDSRVAVGIREIYVAPEFWPWVVAAAGLPVGERYLRDQWSGAVERAGMKDIRLSHLLGLRCKLLEEARQFSKIRLLCDEPREEARLVGQAFTVLALSEDEGRRLLLRVV